MPTTIHTAYSSLINPPSLPPHAPILTRSQIWAGLQRKVRRAQDFVPIIVACEVLEESPEKGEIVRRVQFKQDEGPRREDGSGWVRERCVFGEGCKVTFYQSDGTTITNVISDGPAGTNADLHMTYIFEWRRPDIQEGSPEAEAAREQYRKGAKMAVEKSIEAMREMVRAGEIK